MTSVLFSGCSLVEGYGFKQLKKDPGLFCNIFANEVFGNNIKLDNIGVSGHSNERIFLDSAAKLNQNNYDYAFVCWTALYRYIFWAGLEPYNCKYAFNLHNEEFRDFQGHNRIISGKELKKINNSFMPLNHSHYYIRDLVNYVNILKNLANAKNTKIFFINNILPWDNAYFNYIDTTVIPSMLTDYTKELLDSNHRDDHDINLLYHTMHEDYNNNGGIQQDIWLNLYQSNFNMMIDVNDDLGHPGYQSNKLFADFLIEQLKQNKYYHGI
jgi:hypothetical protein